MSDPTNYDELARRYLDLWQDHVAGAVSDPDAAKAMAMMLTGWQNLANSAGEAFGQRPFGERAQNTASTTDGAQSDGSTSTKHEGQSASESPAASDTSFGTDDVIRLLNQRIARLEERVAALERERSL